MATQQSATIYITNNTDGNAWILLFHTNSSNGTQQGSWNAGPGETVGPLTVYFETGFGTGGILDYWSVLLNVEGSSTPGKLINSGTARDPYWKECQLQQGDASQTITLSASATTFDVALDSGGRTDGMTRLGPYAPITNVFVVMLENHSFDNMFAMSGISGITAASPGDSNSYNDVKYNVKYNVQTSAPVSMHSDPGHELPDVVEQLAGVGASYPSGGPYPTIDNSGFAVGRARQLVQDGDARPGRVRGPLLRLGRHGRRLQVRRAHRAVGGLRPG